MIMHIHFNTSTGYIIAWGDGGDSPSFLDGHDMIEIEKRDIDPNVDKVDPLKLKVVKKTRADLARDLAIEIVRAVDLEMNYTDQFVGAPADRPKKGLFAFDWTGYREAVRLASNLAAPAEILKAWPKRPNGADAIEALRKKAGV